jgi:Lrp/AsnC family transcriptional regulator for asnA, asnC and gidA
MIEDRTLNIIARVNPFRAGLDAYAIVHIDIKPGALLDEAVNKILQFPEVSFLAICVGEYDIVIDVMCRDNDHLKSVIMDRLYEVPGVVDTKTTYYLDVYQWFQPSLKMLEANPDIPD